MPRRTTRRSFMQSAAVAGVGFWTASSLRAQQGDSPNDRIAFACIGVGGKGSSDSSDAGNNGDIVAICDVDERTLDGAARRFPKAKRYNDFRKMLDEMHSSIDAVTVSTPDHTHAPAAAMAMKLGKHCFCQKPLTHSIYEARTLAEIARERDLATMMGNQGTAEPALRKAAAVIQAGALGTVSEVHVWTNRPIWAQGGPRPEPAEVPANVHWDLFLGPAPERPFAPGYHPFAWRGWWDFGTGALGDMACHTMNMPFMALNLRDPVAVTATTSGHNKDSYPEWSEIVYEFPETDSRTAVNMYWYDGGRRPDPELLEGQEVPPSGALLVGEKGKLFSPGDYGGSYRMLGGAEEPDVDFERSPGHFDEWVRAIQGGPAAVSNFPDYAGALTETVLLGNLAVWQAADGEGERVEWDATSLRPTSHPDLMAIVKREYREGWSL